MTYNPYASLMSTPPNVETVGKTEVDARVKGGLMTVCSHAGNLLNPEKTRYCKFYTKSSQRTCCMYYHQEIEVGACDCRKE